MNIGVSVFISPVTRHFIKTISVLVLLHSENIRYTLPKQNPVPLTWFSCRVPWQLPTRPCWKCGPMFSSGSHLYCPGTETLTVFVSVAGSLFLVLSSSFLLMSACSPGLRLKINLNQWIVIWSVKWQKMVQHVHHFFFKVQKQILWDGGRPVL